MRTCPLRAVAFAAGVVLLAAPAAAQDPIEPWLGRLIDEVRVEIEDEVSTDAALLSLIEITAGQPLEVGPVRRTVAQIGLIARFDGVRVEVADGPSGLVVTVRIEPRHPIDRLEFPGATGLSPAVLEAEVRDEFGGLPPAGTNLNAVAFIVERHLREEGYLRARVTPSTVTTHNPDRATLVLSVESGPRATVRATEVVGDSPLSAVRIRQLTATEPGRPYRRRALQVAVAELRDSLSEQGYHAALVSPAVTISDDQTSVDLTLTVEAGPRITIAWSGDSRPSGDVEALVPVQLEGSVDEDLLEDADATLRRALQRDGYRDAVVRHTRDEQGGDLVITFDIQRGRRFRLHAVEIPPTQIGTAVVREALRLSPGQPLDDEAVTAGLERVVLEYQQQGFYAAEAVAEYEEVPDLSTPAEARVVLHPVFTEGPRGTLRQIDFAFVDTSRIAETELRDVMRLQPGDPYSQVDVYLERLAIETLYANRGFPAAVVEILAAIDGDGRDVSLTVRIAEGNQIVIGQITVVGNRRVSEQTILSQLPLRTGQPLGRATLAESQRVLREMGIARARFDFQSRVAGGEQRHLIISVEEAPATTVGYGGGIEGGTRPRSVAGGGVDDRLEFSPRGFFEIGRRHLGGRSRSVNAFARVSFKPRDAPDDPARDGEGFGFNEYRIAATYRERRAFRSATDLLLSVSSEQAVRTSFNFVRQALNAEFLHSLSPRLSVSGRYGLEFTRLFDERFSPEEQSTIDRLFPQVRLSILSTGVLWDLRDAPIATTRGVFLSADVESAIRGIGSEVGYVKTFFQAAGFYPLSSDRRHVIATRAQLGLARGFERLVPVVDADGEPVVPLDGVPLIEPVEDLPASQRFFAGGSTTVRGYQLDRLGVPEILNSNGLSNGGNGVVVLNAELRSVVASLFGRSLAVVGFVDGGNVFARASEIDLGRLRGSAGFGVRYDSPLGPLRLDFGFKTNRLVFNDRRERGWEFHLSIGEAF